MNVALNPWLCPSEREPERLDCTIDLSLGVPNRSPKKSKEVKSPHWRGSFRRVVCVRWHWSNLIHVWPCHFQCQRAVAAWSPHQQPKKKESQFNVQRHGEAGDASRGMSHTPSQQDWVCLFSGDPPKWLCSFWYLLVPL